MSRFFFIIKLDALTVALSQNILGAQWLVEAILAFEDYRAGFKGADNFPETTVTAIKIKGRVKV